jgi:DNA replication ATP-dependent helicase Dna2
MRDYALIQGYPGSGKSSTIVFVARMLAAQGKRVLISSYTHSAVDNCLLKLIEHKVADRWHMKKPRSVVRIGAKTSVHPGVQHLLASRVAVELEGLQPQDGDVECLPSVESLRKAVSEARIVGATALTIPKSPLLVDQHFDVVIVDEAGQITQPALLGALAAADTFVLVGDHLQLPPLVSSECALQAGK